MKQISRSAGTVQKDWAKVQSYDLREGFCIAVVGHEGWNKDSYQIRFCYQSFCRGAMLAPEAFQTFIHRVYYTDLVSEATVPYSLVVSFETVNSEIAIYEAFVQIQQPLQVQQEVQMTVSS